MKILSRTEIKKLERQLRMVRFVLAIARCVRGKLVTRLINHFCYFDQYPHGGLTMIAPYHRHLLINLDVHSWIERKILCAGYFERPVVNILQRILKDGFVAFDIGANIGCHALVMADLVGAGGRVLAFEPNPRIFARLRANISLNRLSNVDAFPIALSNRHGSHALYVPDEDDYNQGLASLHSDNLGPECKKVAVDTTTLDAIVNERKLTRIDLIKIDAEGHEYQVLAGAYEALANFRPILIFEFSERQWRNGGVLPNEVETYLAHFNYQLFVIRRDFTINIEYGIGEECDVLALPEPG